MFLLIDKPKGITSHDVIYSLRKITGIKKIGHAGTLDPNATGLLIVGIGRESTKKLGSLTTETIKTYEAEIFLGEERSTDDEEGEIISKQEQPIVPTLEDVKSVLQKYKGEIIQTPPIYSAIKVKGKKAYEFARKGKEINLPKRKVVIHSNELLEYKFPTISVNFTVSAGTYIRTLAKTVGKDLGTFGYLKNLRRTAIGEFNIKNSVKVDELDSGNWQNYAINIQ